MRPEVTLCGWRDAKIQELTHHFIMNSKMLVGDSTVKATVLIVVMQLWYRCDITVGDRCGD